MILDSIVDLITNSSTSIFVSAVDSGILTERLVNLFQALDLGDVTVQVYLEPVYSEALSSYFVEFYEEVIAEFVSVYDVFATAYANWAISAAEADFVAVKDFFVTHRFGGEYHRFLHDFSTKLQIKLDSVAEPCMLLAVQYRVYINELDVSDLFSSTLFAGLELDNWC